MKHARRYGWTWGCLQGALLIALALIAVPAQALQTGVPYTLRNVHANRCLDVYNWSTSNGGNINLWDCGSGTVQQFVFYAASSGYYTIRNVNSNLCLDVAGSAAGDNVQQWSCSGGSNQEFAVLDAGGGAVTIVAHHSNQALDGWNWGTANGTNIAQWTQTGGANQQFIMTQVGGSSCTPSCSGLSCGDDGCGGSCGTCGAGESCDAGVCVSSSCTPSCSGLSCGDDGCGGSCGSCSGSEWCISGQCVASVADPSVTGPYGVCYTTSNIDRGAYTNARMFYPCAPGSPSNGPVASGVFGASTMSGGYTNSASDMFWLAQHITSHGFIVLAMQPNNTWGYNNDWRDAHKDAYYELVEQATLSGGVVQGHLDTTAIQISGYSKGGGGTLLAAKELSQAGYTLGAVQAYAPYFDYQYRGTNLTAISAPTAIHGGSSDTIAPVGTHAIPMFNSLSSNTTRLLGIYSGLGHTDWYSSNSGIRYKMKTYIVSWMKVYLDGDAAYLSYLDGADHNPSWFTTYTYVP